MDLRRDPRPIFGGTVETAFLRNLDPAIEGDPGHDLAEREMARRAPTLPNAAIRLAPDFLEMRQKRLLQRPSVLVRGEAAPLGLIERVHDFAVHVDLDLSMRAVAASYRLRALVARQPVDFPFR